MYGYVWNYSRPRQPQNAAFAVNVAEGNEEYRITAALPGVKKSDVSLDMNGSYVRISVKAPENEESTAKTVWQEYAPIAATRSVYVGNEVDRDSLHAAMSDGVLTVTVPKTQKKLISVD